MEIVIAVVLLLLVIVWKVALHFYIMPELLMFALGALGHDFTYVQCLSFWLIAIVIIGILKSLFKVEVNNSK